MPHPTSLAEVSLRNRGSSHIYFVSDFDSNFYLVQFMLWDSNLTATGTVFGKSYHFSQNSPTGTELWAPNVSARKLSFSTKSLIKPA